MEVVTVVPLWSSRAVAPALTRPCRAGCPAAQGQRGTRCPVRCPLPVPHGDRSGADQL